VKKKNILLNNWILSREFGKCCFFSSLSYFLLYKSLVTATEFLLLQNSMHVIVKSSLNP